nr:hypothetical protein Iba_chr13fCG6070 [Ipomoea batatas]
MGRAGKGRAQASPLLLRLAKRRGRTCEPCRCLATMHPPGRRGAVASVVEKKTTRGQGKETKAAVLCSMGARRRETAAMLRWRRAIVQDTRGCHNSNRDMRLGVVVCFTPRREKNPREGKREARKSCVVLLRLGAALRSRSVKMEEADGCCLRDVLLGVGRNPPLLLEFSRAARRGEGGRWIPASTSSSHRHHPSLRLSSHAAKATFFLLLHFPASPGWRVASPRQLHLSSTLVFPAVASYDGESRGAAVMEAADGDGGLRTPIQQRLDGNLSLLCFRRRATELEQPRPPRRSGARQRHGLDRRLSPLGEQGRHVFLWLDATATATGGGVTETFDGIPVQRPRKGESRQASPLLLPLGRTERGLPPSRAAASHHAPSGKERSCCLRRWRRRRRRGQGKETKAAGALLRHGCPSTTKPAAMLRWRRESRCCLHTETKKNAPLEGKPRGRPPSAAAVKPRREPLLLRIIVRRGDRRKRWAPADYDPVTAAESSPFMLATHAGNRGEVLPLFCFTGAARKGESRQASPLLLPLGRTERGLPPSRAAASHHAPSGKERSCCLRRWRRRRRRGQGKETKAAGALLRHGCPSTTKPAAMLRWRRESRCCLHTETKKNAPLEGKPRGRPPSAAAVKPRREPLLLRIIVRRGDRRKRWAPADYDPVTAAESSPFMLATHAGNRGEVLPLFCFTGAAVDQESKDGGG